MTLSISKPETHLFPSQFSALKAHLPSDILQFCLQQGILQYVPVTMDLIKKYLPLASPDWDFEREVDPDSGEEYLLIHVTLKGDIHEIVDSYDNYIHHWVSAVPWPERDKICLIYSLL